MPSLNAQLGIAQLKKLKNFLNLKDLCTKNIIEFLKIFQNSIF